MKIGIMLRHYDQHGGGVKVYTKNLLPKLFELDTKNEYVLMYQNPKLVGTYSEYSNVREIAQSAPHILLWDQIVARQMEKKENFDLIFNPKYSLPLMAKCKTVFVCHGCDWYVMPWGSPFLDRLSHTYLMPRYVKKANEMIAVSASTREHMVQYLGVEKERVHVVHLGVDERFREIADEVALEAVRKKYSLPEKYFLYVGQIYPAKNFGRLIEAYAKIGPKMGIPLVVAGALADAHKHDSGKEIKLIRELGLDKWVIRPGWIDREELPKFYRLALALLMPSLYEACPSPPIEAMASQCPVVTANRYGTKEVVGDAAVLVDPEDVDSIADGMERIATDQLLRKELIEKGVNRAAEFNWTKCAKKTLEVLEGVMER